MEKNTSTTPLWKELDVKRFKERVFQDAQGGIGIMANNCGYGLLEPTDGYTWSNLDVNKFDPSIEYMVLSYNNLASLAEALGNLLKEARQNSFNLHKNINDTPAEAAAAEALKQIS